MPVKHSLALRVAGAGMDFARIVRFSRVATAVVICRLGWDGDSRRPHSGPSKQAVFGRWDCLAAKRRSRSGQFGLQGAEMALPAQGDALTNHRSLTSKASMAARAFPLQGLGAAQSRESRVAALPGRCTASSAAPNRLL